MHERIEYLEKVNPSIKVEMNFVGGPDSAWIREQWAKRKCFLKRDGKLQRIMEREPSRRLFPLDSIFVPLVLALCGALVILYGIRWGTRGIR